MQIPVRQLSPNAGKFIDPDVTATGARRASVDPVALTTLWINTGSLCNLACENCYLESTPTNDRLSYISVDEVRALLDEIEQQQMPTTEIGFTGGEPFLNKDLVPMLTLCLERGFDVLVLTNAMNTMMREMPLLRRLHDRYDRRLKLRVSLDHYSETSHAKERGRLSWKPAIKGLKTLSAEGFHFSIVGRTFWGEGEDSMRDGYAQMFATEDIGLDAYSSTDLMLFPEMDAKVDVPEITTACWGILNKSPADMMCATSRMVVKHKGDNHISVMACTLLPYDSGFSLGSTLTEAWRPVKLNHPHCSKFCVLGGGSCSG